MNAQTPLEPELRALEKLLEQQPLREPSAALDQRVAQLLDRRSTAPSRSVLARLLPIALAAAAALALFIMPRPESAPIRDDLAIAPKNSVDPVRIEQVFTRPLPGELVFTEDHTPLRPVHRHVVEHRRWVDPHDQARIEVTIPRDEIVFISAPID